MWCPDSATGVDPDYFAEALKPRVLPLLASHSSRWPTGLSGGSLEARTGLPGRRTVRAFDTHARAVAAEIQAGGFDVVFAGSCFVLGAPPLARYLDGPTALYLGEPNRSLYEAPSAWAPMEPSGGMKGRAKGAYKLAVAHRMRRLVIDETANAKAFDRVLVNSRYSAEAVARAYGLSARVCSLGVDPGEWEVPDLPSRPDPVVVGIGTLGRHKGVDLAVAAVAAVAAEDRPELRWLCNRSDPHYKAELQRQASAAGVRLTIKEGLGTDALRDELASAWFLVAAARLEPFGYTPLEAAALGVPTVAVAEGGFRETVVDGRTGLLVERDPALMAGAMTRLIRDEGLARALGEQARADVRERWSMTAAIDAIEQQLLAVATGA